MYIPPYNAETELTTLQEMIATHPLGAWVTLGSAGLTANHIPFLIDRSRGPYGCLRAHVARANPIWRELIAGQESLVIFQGPQSYITPNWYPTHSSSGQVVPTWNYVLVHARGIAQVHQDPAWIFKAISDLSEQQEAGQVSPWKVSDAPADYIKRLARAVVGIEIPLDSLIGKWKLSQDEALADRHGTVAGLSAQPDANSQALADLVQSRIP
ncbi:FMN-binding negative transcriptional regulator [Paucibacter sp. Y2R2-4]|uniref:FMN-binding negative transcriptional regulator n=1 Tax=Paucibacter sp. Y2R2-4 TaxID=2893553 RepID=UPI0021E4418A|nr:FMN-binding negative transcriptional regulator [Paucibacter sp. Y2R2-4]MCV2352206.1 FMN-binding negative transcriptional regulator [Paucibacter sp. Y2R2-4]